jgi:hypothetical protein
MRFNKTDQCMLAEAYDLVNEISDDKVKQAIDSARSSGIITPFNRSRVNRVENKLLKRLSKNNKVFSIKIPTSMKSHVDQDSTRDYARPKYNFDEEKLNKHREGLYENCYVDRVSLGTLDNGTDYDAQPNSLGDRPSKIEYYVKALIRIPDEQLGQSITLSIIQFFPLVLVGDSGKIMGGDSNKLPENRVQFLTRNDALIFLNSVKRKLNDQNINLQDIDFTLPTAAQQDIVEQEHYGFPKSVNSGQINTNITGLASALDYIIPGDVSGENRLQRRNQYEEELIQDITPVAKNAKARNMSFDLFTQLLLKKYNINLARVTDIMRERLYNWYNTL